jgi:hypothetical protein
METPEAIRQRGPLKHSPVSEASTEHPSSSSEADQNKVGAPMDNERSPTTPIDLSVFPTDPADVAIEAVAEPVV